MTETVRDDFDDNREFARCSPQQRTLDQLLEGVTDENVHGEWDTGPTAGREVW